MVLCVVLEASADDERLRDVVAFLHTGDEKGRRVDSRQIGKLVFSDSVHQTATVVKSATDRRISHG